MNYVRDERGTERLYEDVERAVCEAMQAPRGALARVLDGEI